MRLRVRDAVFFGAAFLAMVFLASPPLTAATIAVNSTADCDTGGCDSGNITLRMAIESVNAGSDQADTVHSGTYGTNDTIGFIFGSYPQTIVVSGSLGGLPKLTNDVVISGPGIGNLKILQGGNWRPFFVGANVNVTIMDLRIESGVPLGSIGGKGNSGGGGGGAGLGGEVFVDTNATLDVQRVYFFGGAVGGGDGGDATLGSGSSVGGGGGGTDFHLAGSDGNTGTGDGGKGADGGVFGGTGGAGGSSGGCTSGANGSADGAGGGGASNCSGSVGGKGSFGGGGGGGSFGETGGAGGFGGGGGGVGDTVVGGPGGLFAGNGGESDFNAGGGGGAGLGGAIFIRDGATLKFDECTFDSDFAGSGFGGAGDGSVGSTPGQNGLGKGGAIFGMDNAILIQGCASTYINNQATDEGGVAGVDDNDIYYQGTIVKQDTTNPVITCPADPAPVPNTPGQCSAIVNPGTATATDNCGVASIKGVRSDALPLTDPYPVGTTFITWTATDTSGNTDVCLQTIVVQDKENPVITCVAPVTANADANCQATVPNMVSTVSDNCPGVGVVQTPPAGTVETGAATYPVHIVATDASGNTAFCDTSFTVKDVTPPVVTSSTVIHILSSDHTMKDVIFSESAVDNCDGAITTVDCSATGAHVCVQIFANENEELKTSSGDAKTSPDARGIGTDYNTGKWEGKLALRQERTNNGQGRVYLIKVSATDKSGNTGYSCQYVISPKSSKRQDIQKAQTLGDAVVGPCNATGLVPLNYSLNPDGFGPVIGNKQ